MRWALAVSFQEDLQQARIYEIVVRNLLLNRSGFCVCDVHGVPQCYHKGDLWVCWLRKDKNPREFFVEVKSDNRMHRTGNVFIEMEKTHHDLPYSDGWFASEYDFIAYVDVVQCLVYYIDFRKMKREFDENTMQKFYKANIKLPDCGGTKRVNGYALPISFCQKKGWISGKVDSFSITQLESAKLLAKAEK